jgi:nucleoid DNA-binding protein
MTYNQLIHKFSRERKMAESEVRAIVDEVLNFTLDALMKGDDVKLKNLGTFYPSSYTARMGTLEFGGRGEGGHRRRLRFRPFDSTNQKLTDEWNKNNPLG